MSRKITGVLYNPDMTLLGPGELKFTAIGNYDHVLAGSSSVASVTGTGIYDITLRDGIYRTYFTPDEGFPIYLGRVSVEFGPEVSLEDILQETSMLITDVLSAYIAARISEAVEGLQPAGDYLTSEYGNEDVPSIPSQLLLQLDTTGSSINPIYFIKANWSASVNSSGVPINYLVTYFDNADPDQKTTTPTNGLSFTISPVTVGHIYTVRVSAYAAVNTNAPSVGYVSDTIAVATGTITGIDTSTVTASAGLETIILRWSNPASVPRAITHVYASTLSEFTAGQPTEVYRGLATTYIHHTTESDPLFFKFIVEGAVGETSAPSLAVGPFTIMGINESTIGRIVGEAALEAHHLADGIDIQDAIGANTIVASKLAIFDLTNLAENNNFSLYDSDNLTYPGWNYGDTPPISYGANGYIVFGQNSTIDNNMRFSCSEGDKFYGSANLTWSVACGTADKGVQVVFVNSLGTELNAGFTATNTTSEPQNLVTVEGFGEAPANAVYGFIRLKTGAVSENITFSDVICRKGAAVLIEDGEITANKVNVLDLFAANIMVNNGGSIRVGENPGNVFGGGAPYGGLILGDSIGLIGYDSGGTTTFSIDPITGAAYFAGAINASSGSISGNLSVGASLIMNTNSKIYSAGKTAYGSATKGFYLEQANNGRFHIGDNSNFLKWNGASLSIGKSNLLRSGTLTRPTDITYWWLSLNWIVCQAENNRAILDGKTFSIQIATGYYSPTALTSATAEAFYPSVSPITLAWWNSDTFLGYNNTYMDQIKILCTSNCYTAGSGGQVYINVTFSMPSVANFWGSTKYYVRGAIYQFSWSLRGLV